MNISENTRKHLDELGFTKTTVDNAERAVSTIVDNLQQSDFIGNAGHLAHVELCTYFDDMVLDVCSAFQQEVVLEKYA